MTDAGWAREKPTEPGWYWHRVDKNWRTYVVHVYQLQGALFVEFPDKAKPLIMVAGEWLGPITPDSYQQGRVAAFRQGIEKLREREKFYTEQEAISQGQMRLTRGLQRNESSCCIHELEKLAQQAQEGEGDGKAVRGTAGQIGAWQGREGVI